MADVGLDTLLSALLSVDKEAEESSPFAPLGSSADLIGKALLQSAPNYSIKENILGGLITGLVGGFADNLTNSYREKQNTLAQDFLGQALSGGSIFDKPRPNGMAPSIFSKLKNTASIFQKVREFEQADEARKIGLSTQEAIRRAEGLAPIEIATEVAKDKARAQIQRELYGSLGGIGGLPPGMQDDALRQQTAASENIKAQDFIDQQFDQAKQIRSLEAMIPGTTGANNMKGIQIALTNALQKVVGRELNEGTRQQLLGALPDWNDTEGQIEEKKVRFKGIIDAISPATPLIGSAGGSIAESTAASTPEVPPGMKLQRNRITGETRLVPQ